MTPYLSAATKVATARRALLLLALLALISAGTIMGYFSVLDLIAINRATEEDATRAFGTDGSPAIAEFNLCLVHAWSCMPEQDDLARGDRHSQRKGPVQQSVGHCRP